MAGIAIIFLCVFALKSESSKIIFVSVVSGLSLLLVVVLIVLRKNKLALFASVILLAVLPVASLCVSGEKVESCKSFAGKKVVVEGRICENYKITERGSMKLVLDDVVIIDGEKSFCTGKKFEIYTSPQNLQVSEYKVGRFVEVFVEPEFYDFENGGTSELSNDIVGSAYCNYYELKLTGTEKLTLRDKIKNFVYEKLESSGAEHYEIGYAMLFGDTSYIESNELNIMRSAGIAHLLAVSGLHISVIVVFLNFVFRKLRVSRLICFIVVSAALIFYCYICGFSVSVVRASIMSILSLYALLRGKPYDSLSALGLAGFIILLFSPLKIFNLSFILSFGAVLSIILTSAVLNKFLSKFLYKKFAGVISVSVGVQFGIIFTNLCYFGQYPLLSILTNIVSIPIQSLAFLVLVVSLPLYLIFPFMSFAVGLFGNITDLVLRLNNFIGSANLFLTAQSISALIIPLSFIWLFAVSDKTMCKRRWKVLSSVIIVIIVALTQLVF